MRPDDEGDTPHSVAMSASESLQRYGSCLTPYEKNEIVSYSAVYYCGQGCEDKVKAPTGGPNDGFDTTDGEYIFRPKDHIAYRYEILEELGSGAFGQVLKAFDHANDQTVAVKLIRNQRKVLQQAVQEIKILEHVNNRDPKNLYGIVRMLENFSFRGHTCISYELLGMNLYEYLKERDFYPMPLTVVRGIAARMLVALTFLGRENIIHCDLKPENILIRESDPSVVKLADLGSASFEAGNCFMYIQSRFYRAPEVILEQKYSKAIDWWSFGCILCELANGDPVFPGDDEKDQLGCIMEYLGPPPHSFIQASSARRKREFFDEHLQPRARKTKTCARVPGSKSLAKFLGVSDGDDFLSFVMQFLQWDPAARVSPREAMRHKWISNEFVFPSKAEKSTAAAAPNAETSSLAAAPEVKDSGGAPTSAKTEHGKPAWQAQPGVAVAADGAPASTARTLPQEAQESAVRSKRSDPHSVNGHHCVSAATVPPLTASNGSSAPRATAQSTEAAPRRPTASQRRSGQVFRRRQRRSTEIAEVEMPGSATSSASVTIVASTTEERSQSCVVAIPCGIAPVLSSGSTVPCDLPRSGGNEHAPPALKPGVLSPSALSTPSNPTVATTLPVGKEGSRGLVATTALLSPLSNQNCATDTPGSAEKSNHVLELRRKFESGAAAAASQGGKEHLEGSAKGAANGELRLASVAEVAPNEKNGSQGSISNSAKQRVLHEPEPTTPPQAAKGKAAATRRREYSLTIDGTPTPLPLESSYTTEQTGAQSKEYMMPSVVGHAAFDRNHSLLSASRPHEPGSSFIYAGRHLNHSSTDGTRSSDETVMLSSPPNELLVRDTSVSIGTSAAPRQLSESSVPRRFTRRVMPGSREGGTHEAKGRQPAAAGMLRLAPPRQVLVQRQRQSVAAALTEAKGSSSPTTALPPLKRSSVR